MSRRVASVSAAEATSANIVAASLEAYVEALNAILADPSWAGVAAGATSQGGLSPADPGAASADFDDEATTIDTTEWFNR